MTNWSSLPPCHSRTPASSLHSQLVAPPVLPWPSLSLPQPSPPVVTDGPTGRSTPSPVLVGGTGLPPIPPSHPVRPTGRRQSSSLPVRRLKITRVLRPSDRTNWLSVPSDSGDRSPRPTGWAPSHRPALPSTTNWSPLPPEPVTPVCLLPSVPVPALSCPLPDQRVALLASRTPSPPKRSPAGPTGRDTGAYHPVPKDRSLTNWSNWSSLPPRPGR